MGLAAGLAALAALGGCATGPVATVIELEPMRFEATREGTETRVEQMDAKVLFGEAGRAFETADYRTAARKYRLVHERFAESEYATVSAFNGALALERDGRCGEAVALYEDVVRATAGSKDAQDSLFRIAACEEQLERWQALEKTADRILAPHYERISVVDRIAALAERGLARQHERRLAEAERDYKEALALYQQNLENKALRQSPQVSMAQLQIGEIYRELFASIRFKLPLETMARDLEDKSNFFLMAQSAYLRALRLQQADYAVIAGYRLGALYEVMYDDMMAAEIPPELTRDEVELYYEELKKKIRPLLVRAIDIYERNLRMGQRIGTKDEWVKRTEASLARLKEVLRQDSSREAEAELRRAAN